MKQFFRDKQKKKKKTSKKKNFKMHRKLFFRIQLTRPGLMAATKIANKKQLKAMRDPRIARVI